MSPLHLAVESNLCDAVVTLLNQGSSISLTVRNVANGKEQTVEETKWRYPTRSQVKSHTHYTLSY